MNIYTAKGRIQTKLLTFIVTAAVTGIFSAFSPINYWPVFAISIVAGLLLELLWGWVITYQAGYLTWIVSIAEFCSITAGAIILEVPITIPEAALYYWVTWGVIQLFLIYGMPIINLSWADNGGEMW
ncbi:MAG: hypothetical protein HYZ62_01540 [Candidatus Andersenbacteria bacterium]|nr:hypothetical protein [Candidatus Andersenbacteria bacterium]